MTSIAPFDSRKQSKLAGRLLVAAAALMWSSSGVFARWPGFEAWPEIERGALLAFWRAFFAGLVLMPAVRRPRFDRLLVPLVISFAVMNISYLTAMILTTPANAIWLQNAAPWWVFLISVVLFRDPVVRRDLVPLAFGMLGVGTVLCFEFMNASGQSLVGISCGVVSGVFYAAVIVLMGKLSKENPAWLVVVNHAVAAAILLPWVICLGRWPSIEQLAVLAAFGAFQMAVPYVLLIRGLRSISAQEAVAIALIEPVLMPVWAFLVWGIRASWWTLIGAALILTGLLLRYAFWDLLANRWRNRAGIGKAGR